MKRILGVFVAMVLGATSVLAQGSIDAEKVYLWTSSTQRMNISTGSGAPSGGVTGDTYIDYATGELYTKRSGTWTVIPRLEAAQSWTAAQAFNAGWTGTTGSLSSTLHVGGNFDVATTKFTVAAASGNTLAAGTLDATGDFKVNTNKFTVTASSGNTAVAGTLQVTGNETVSADILPAVNYVSNLGNLTTKFLTVHGAELWVETLVAQNTMATIGGRIMVGPTNTLTTDLAAISTSIVVKYNNFANGDRVVALANGDIEWFAVTSGPSGTGPYTYTVTRNLDGTGANAWPSGTAIFDTGTTGSGFIDMFSAGDIRGIVSGPTIIGQIRTGTTYSNIEPRWAIGNLNGAYGYSSTTYGVAMGDPSNTNITIDASNGFQIRSGTTVKLKADTSGNLSLTGDLAMSTSGVFRAGATAFGTGTGWWLDYNGGTPRFRIGNPAAQYLQWDGTNVSVISGGGNVVLDSSGVTIAAATGGAYASDHAYRFTATTTSLGMGGDASTASLRQLFLVSQWTGAGTITSDVSINVSGGTGSAAAAIFDVQHTGATSSMSMQTQTLTIEAGAGNPTAVNLTGGIQVGAATGGNLGNGKINVSGDLYKNNTAYTNPDYVFEHWATGAVTKYASNPGAATYRGLMPLDDLRDYVRTNYRFPQISDGAAGMFARGDVALELIEQAHLYIFQLEARIRALEQQTQKGGQR